MRILLGALLLALAGASQAGAQMPDARQMSGLPLPVAELPVGTVSVRLVREQLTNPIANHKIELTADGEVRTLTTDETGRANFEGLAPGATVVIRAVVGSETLQSQEFRVPPAGGSRLILAASDPETARAAEEAARQAALPAAPGEIVIGPQSRIVVELAEEFAEIYYLLEIRNTAATPVEPAAPFVLQLPEQAIASTILDGSSPQAVAAGPRITVKAPFVPGSTTVQAAFRLPYRGGRVQFSQVFPATFEQPNLTVEKLPGVTLRSPQFHDERDMASGDQVYLVAHAKTVAAGTPLDIRVDGVPRAASWPRALAMTLAVLLLAAGAWGAATAHQRGGRKPAAIRQLEARREKLFAELTALEQRHRDGALPEPQYTRRRRDIVAELERVYGELDASAAA
jgi:hypothetical protein